MKYLKVKLWGGRKLVGSYGNQLRGELAFWTSMLIL